MFQREPRRQAEQHVDVGKTQVAIEQQHAFPAACQGRGEIKTAQEAQTAAQTELAAAQAAEQATLKVAKVKPVAYSRLLRLGKAIPADSDFQSLLVQLNDVTTAADVDFVSLSVSAWAA